MAVHVHIVDATQRSGHETDLSCSVGKHDTDGAEHLQGQTAQKLSGLLLAYRTTFVARHGVAGACTCLSVRCHRQAIVILLQQPTGVRIAS